MTCAQLFIKANICNTITLYIIKLFLTKHHYLSKYRNLYRFFFVINIVVNLITQCNPNKAFLSLTKGTIYSGLYRRNLCV